MSFRYTWGMHQYLRRLFKRRRVQTVTVQIRVHDRARAELRKLSAETRESWPPAYEDRPDTNERQPGWDGLDDIGDS